MTRILILALIVRLGVLASGLCMNGSWEGSLAPDSTRYLALAKGIEQSGVFEYEGVAETLRTPGYPLFLSMGFWIGSPMMWVFSIQMALALATVWMVGGLARDYAGSEKAGHVAALLMAMEPLSITYTGFVLTETLFAFLVVAALGCVWKGWRPEGAARWILVGSLLLGCGLLVRPSGVLLPYVLALGLFLGHPRSWSLSLARWACLLLPCAFIAFFWVARNASVAGYTGLCSVSEANLYWNRAARVEAAVTGRGFLEVSSGFERELREECLREGWTQGEYYSQMQSRAMDILWVHPGLTAGYFVTDALRTLWDPGAVDLLKVLGHYREGGGLQMRVLDNGLISTVSELFRTEPFLVASMASLGLYLLFLYILAVLSFRGGGHPVMRGLLPLIIFFFIGISGGSNALARMRHPAMPFVCIMAGAGFVARRGIAMKAMRWMGAGAVVVMAACALGNDNLPPRDPLVWEKEADAFQIKLERGLFLRQQTLQLGRELEKRQGPLLGFQIERLRLDIEEHLKLKESVMQNIQFSRSFIEGKDQGESTDREALLALAGAALLYDNFVISLNVFQEDARLRKVVRNEVDDPQWSKKLKTAMWEFHDPASRRLFRRALDHVGEFLDGVKMPPGGSRGEWLMEFCRQSPSIATIRNDHPLRDYARVLGLFSTVLASDTENIGQSSFNTLSGSFGNVVGLVETRKGLLLGKAQELEHEAGGLKPLDILLEKTPFRLTDKFIPGHFGHVAVWVGRERELRELGIWDHPSVQPHQAKIREGAGVLEALRNGVQLNTLENFMNVDDAAVLRHGSLPDGEKRAAVLRAFAQIGKDYDFNFDVETADRIVCSELVYHVFTQESWSTTKSMGRHTLCPDEVAKRVRPGGPFEVRAFFHEGCGVKDPEAFCKLLAIKKN